MAFKPIADLAYPPYQAPFEGPDGLVNYPWRSWLDSIVTRLGKGADNKIQDSQTVAEFAAIGQDQTGYIDEQVDALRTDIATSGIDIQGALDDLEQRLRTEIEINRDSPISNDEESNFDNFGMFQQEIQDAISGVVKSFNGRTGVVVPQTGDYDFTQISGNLAVTQLDSGTGASSATFWRGDGVWAIPAGGGSSSAPDYEEITATAAQTVFNTTVATLANAGGLSYLQVTQNGLILREGAGADYTVTGATQITLTSGASLGDELTFRSAVSSVAPDYEEITATAAQTVFNTTINTIANGGGKAFLQITINGIVLREGAGADYTVTGATQITTTFSCISGDELTFRAWT